MNKLFKVNYMEWFDDAEQYVRHSHPMDTSKYNIESLIKDAYQHPCENIAFDPEYGLYRRNITNRMKIGIGSHHPSSSIANSERDGPFSFADPEIQDDN